MERRLRIAVSLAAACFLACIAALGAPGDETETKGMITFLMQQGGVPVRHIVAPGAMGE